MPRSLLGLPDDEFVVLTSFDFNSWMTRKNPQAAIAAFLAAFPRQRRDVRLLVKTINGQRQPQALAALRAAIADDDRIEVLHAGHCMRGMRRGRAPGTPAPGRGRPRPPSGRR